MSKNLLKKIFVLLILVITFFSINPCSFAADDTPGGGTSDISTDDYKNIYGGGIPTKVQTVGGNLIGIVQIIGVGIAFIMIIIIGAKYIMASANEKASLKGQLVIYLIGAILLFAGTAIFSIIAQTANELDATAVSKVEFVKIEKM